MKKTILVMLTAIMTSLFPPVAFGDAGHSFEENKHAPIFSRPYQLSSAIETLKNKLEILHKNISDGNLDNVNGVIGDMTIALGEISEAINRDESASIAAKHLERSWRFLYEASDSENIDAAQKELENIRRNLTLLIERLEHTQSDSR